MKFVSRSVHTKQQSFLWPEDVEEHEELVSELLGIWDANKSERWSARSTRLPPR